MNTGLTEFQAALVFPLLIVGFLGFLWLVDRFKRKRRLREVGTFLRGQARSQGYMPDGWMIFNVSGSLKPIWIDLSEIMAVTPYPNPDNDGLDPEKPGSVLRYRGEGQIELVQQPAMTVLKEIRMWQESLRRGYQ